MSILILAEKPSLARDIAGSLGIQKKNDRENFEENGIIVASLSGHLLEAHYELPPYTKENLPIKGLDNPTMQPKQTDTYIKKRVKSVSAELKRKDISEIVSAGDADQEGSLLIYEMLEYAKVLDKKITRMWIQAVDEETLKNAFDNRYDIEKDIPLVEAAKSRALADVRVGMNFSRLFSLKGDFRASVGRVRTALMQIIKYREDEIKNFIPTPYYNIRGTFTNELLANLVMEDEAKKLTTHISQEYYSTIKEYLKKETHYTIAEVGKTAQKKYPDLLPNQNDILKSVTKLHEIKAKKVVEAMQNLYEKGFISYPRTEKRHLPQSLYTKVKSAFDALTQTHHKEINGSQISLEVNNKRIFDDTKVEEHFAVVPWIPKTQSEIDALLDLERKTYDYIVAKFLMACMQPYEYNSTSIKLQAKDSNFVFKAEGKVEISKGFKNYLYITNKESEDVVLPSVQEGQTVTLLQINEKKDTTKPPALLDEPELLEMMENIQKLYSKQVDNDEEDYYSEKFSLGTPATRSHIIDSVINQYKYVEYNKKGRLETTGDGKKLLKIIGDAINIKMTAQFEKEMQKIQKQKSYSTIFDKMIEEYVYKVIQKELPMLPDTQEKQQTQNTTTNHQCPMCGKAIIETAKTFKCQKNIYKDGKQSGCKFSIFKDQTKFFGRELTSEDLSKLLEATKENPLKEEKNGIYINLNSQYLITTVFDSTKNEKTGELVETPKTYRLDDKFIYNNFMYEKITKNEAKKLFKYETVEFKRKTKAGQEYTIKAKMSEEKSGTLEIL